MLRELNLDEMEMVSGGEDVIVASGQRVSGWGPSSVTLDQYNEMYGEQFQNTLRDSLNMGIGGLGETLPGGSRFGGQLPDPKETKEDEGSVGVVTTEEHLFCAASTNTEEALARCYVDALAK